MAKTREYHLIELAGGDSAGGISHGGFVSLAGAREYAREEMLAAWEVWCGSVRVERHDPVSEQPRQDSESAGAP